MPRSFSTTATFWCHQYIYLENLIERNRSIALAPMPLHIALITADESAAQADFMHSLIESRLPWRVEFIDSKVQGAGAERTISAALRTAQRNKVDVIALVRGGGSRLNSGNSSSISESMAA